MIATSAFAFAATFSSFSGQVTRDVLNGALTRLRSLDTVAGRAVGYAGTPGEFHRLYEVILRDGTSDDFVRLAQDESVIVRAMGLVCMAQRDPKRAVPLLKSRLPSREAFMHGPGGCCFWTISEGEFAWRLLHNAAYLQMFAQPKSLLATGGCLLDLELLANDGLRRLHRVAAEQIEKSLKAGEMKLEQAWFAAQADAPAMWQIVKAIGRVPPSAKTRRFLLACAADEKLPEAVRLAAASGLTRDAHPDVVSFLAKHGEVLDQLARYKPGHGFLAILRHRAERDRAADSLRRDNAEDIKGFLSLVAYKFDEPFAAEDLIAGVSWPARSTHPELANIVAQSLLRLSARLSEVSQPWNTDSIAIDVFMDFLESDDATDLRTLLGDVEWRQFVQNVRAAAERRAGAALAPR